MRRFRNRKEAGHELGELLRGRHLSPSPLVLALPRGGVPVAEAVALALAAPWDLFIVRKLGVPGQEELAMGAIASGGYCILNHDILETLGISNESIEAACQREEEEIQRREDTYRGGLPPPKVKGRMVVVVDDGLATGATMLAALGALRRQQPARLIAAVPVAPLRTLSEVSKAADDVVCLMSPTPFWGVGQWYEDFSQTEDNEVTELLARRSPPKPGAEFSQPSSSP